MSTILIVGANRGIGFCLTQQLAAKGHSLIATTRRPSPELAKLDNVRVVEGVDVTDDEGVGMLASALREDTIDILVVNAGILRPTSLAQLDLDVVREQLEVNAIGPLRVVGAVHERLARGGKVGIITSRMGSIEDNDSGGSYGYRMSKAAVNAAGKSLSIDLAPREISVALLHPGWVRTDMTGQSGHLDPDESAALLIDRLQDLDMENTGAFWHAKGEELPW